MCKWFPARLMRIVRGEERAPTGARSLETRPDPVAALGETYQRAAESLVDSATLESADHRANRAKVSREGAHELIWEFQLKLLRALEERGYPFHAFEVYRDHERQLRLLKQRVTRAGPGQSAHNYGMAVDIVHSARFWDLTEKEWDIVGAIGKEVARKMKLKIQWGGDWSFWDPAHWELDDWRDRARVQISEQAAAA